MFNPQLPHLREELTDSGIFMYMLVQRHCGLRSDDDDAALPVWKFTLR